MRLVVTLTLRGKNYSVTMLWEWNSALSLVVLLILFLEFSLFDFIFQLISYISYTFRIFLSLGNVRLFWYSIILILKSTLFSMLQILWYSDPWTNVVGHMWLWFFSTAHVFLDRYRLIYWKKTNPLQNSHALLLRCCRIFQPKFFDKVLWLGKNCFCLCHINFKPYTLSTFISNIMF